VQLIAISKYQPSNLIREAFEAGQCAFGENYAQEIAGKQSELSDLPNISWHFTGHLQSNKAKLVVGHCKLIQSVDSVSLAGKIAKIAEDIGHIQDILVEVNLGGDPSKTGVMCSSVAGLCESIISIPGLRLKGLMAIAPTRTRGVPGAARECFASLHQLFEKLPQENREILSMGMSGDFEDAIAEGATMVRVGSALFGQRRSIPPVP
jgi:hypothetical protein